MKQLLDHITSLLATVYPREEAKELAYWLLEEVTGKSRAELWTCKGTENIPNTEIYLQRLLKKEPIQYIFGHTCWMGLDMMVNSSTLIPRPETAELIPIVESLIQNQKNVRILDIGTGSGAIAISLKKRHPEWIVDALDISSDALDTAQQNAAKNQVSIDFIQGDILNSQLILKDDYTLIVSNPPYVMDKEKATMDRNVLDWEPAGALFVPDNDPLLFYRVIAQRRLGKYLAIEINEQLGQETQALLSELGYSNIILHQDSYGKDRFIEAGIPE